MKEDLIKLKVLQRLRRYKKAREKALIDHVCYDCLPIKRANHHPSFQKLVDSLTSKIRIVLYDLHKVGLISHDYEPGSGFGFSTWQLTFEGWVHVASAEADAAD